MPLSYQLPLGLILAVFIALLAHRAHNLSRSGALAAIFVGTIVFGIGGWQWAILLLTFFITSSVLTRTSKKRKQGLSEKFSKGGQRDAGQVFGNGSIAAVFAALHFFYPQATWPWMGFAASLAAINADTWATELGVLSAHPPRLITDLRKVVERGTSGGISLTGTFASLAGAALIGILASLLDPSTALSAASQSDAIERTVIISLAGLAGSLLDSWLGATVQGMYYCPKDKKETEKHPLHTCGTQTIHIRGWKWLDNDLVNLACSAVGIVAAVIGMSF